MYQAITSLYWQSGLSVSDEQRILFGGIKDEFEAEICPICLDFTKNFRHGRFSWVLSKRKQKNRVVRVHILIL